MIVYCNYHQFETNLNGIYGKNGNVYCNNLNLLFSSFSTHLFTKENIVKKIKSKILV